jgi:xylose dehydrogenase (NAD/NADP)
MPEMPLRWGLLSTARINNALIGPLRSSKRNRLQAVASRTQERADAYARKHKIKKAYGSYAELLADPEIDVIYNPLPNHLHAEWTIKAVEAGKHVLFEKPLALTVAEVDAITAAARSHDRVVAEAFMYRSHAQTRTVKELVEAGKIGKVKLVRGSFTFKLTELGDYRLDPAMGGGGLWDVGCYPLSYTRSVLGAEPLEVFGQQVTGPTGVDESIVAQLRFPGDVFAQFDCSIAVPFHVFMEVVGDEGTLIVPNPFNPGSTESIFLPSKGKMRPFMVKGTPAYASEVEDMADAIRRGTPQTVSLEDSRANTAVILALFESARSGKPVKM